MPKGFGYGLKAVLPLVLLALTLMQPTPDARASTGDTLGFFDGGGTFIPMCRVKKAGSLITLTKVNPRDSFDLVELKFLLPRSAGSSGVKGLFIQWEKTPGKMGREWVIGTHSGYSNGKRLFRAPWKISPSFRIVDRGDDRSFRRLPWYKIIDVSIDGRKMIRKPPETATEQPTERPRARVEEASSSSEQPIHATARPQPRAQTTLPWSRLMALQRDMETKHRELLDRIVKLENSVNAAQNSVASIRQWFYWGPLISLTLSILFTCVTLFLTFTRLSRSRDQGRGSYTPYTAPRYRPATGFRNRR